MEELYHETTQGWKILLSTRQCEWIFSLTSKPFNLLVLKGEWKLLSENKDFVVCAIETGKSHLYTKKIDLFYLEIS